MTIMGKSFVCTAILAAAGMAWAGDSADDVILWGQPSAEAVSLQKTREERLLRQVEAAERRAEAAERRVAQEAGTARAAEVEPTPAEDEPLSQESLREERLWRQLEAAERRAEAAEKALREEEAAERRRQSFAAGKDFGAELPEWLYGGSVALRVGKIFADDADPLIAAELNKTLGHTPLDLDVQFVNISEIGGEDDDFWVEDFYYFDISGIWRFRREETVSPFVGLGVRHLCFFDDESADETGLMGQIGVRWKHDLFTFTGKILAAKDIREAVGVVDFPLHEHFLLNGFIEILDLDLENDWRDSLDDTFFVAGAGLTIPF